MTEKTNPVKFILKNQDVILEAYQSNNRSPKATWDKLTETLPQLGQVMSFNTFKQYITPFVLIMDAVTHELHNRKDLKEVKQSLHKNIDGWTVHLGKDGYFRLHRRIDGKLRTIYGGKFLNKDHIREKIKAKEKDLTRSGAEIETIIDREREKNGH